MRNRYDVLRSDFLHSQAAKRSRPESQLQYRYGGDNLNQKMLIEKLASFSTVKSPLSRSKYVGINCFSPKF